MKYIYLLLLLVSTSITSQTVEVTPIGLVNSEDKNTSYFVVNSEGSIQELHNKVLNYLNSFYKSPRDVLTTSSPNQIVVNAIAQDKIGDPHVDIYYNINILFKENRVRIDLPKLDMNFLLSNGSKRVLHFSMQGRSGFSDHYGIWEKDRLRFPEAKTEIEDFLNNYLSELVSLIKTDDDW